MDRIEPLLCILMCIAIVSCSNEDKRGTKITSEIAGSASENFGKEKLGAMERAAAKGDRHAQALVETYYLNIRDWSRYEEWLERGAQKNDPAAMQRLAAYISKSGGRQDCAHAASLLHKARELTTERDSAIRAVIDADLKLIEGDVDGIPSCINNK
ncbi:hypothetical protein CQ393_12135 [Stenotrophomonas sp. MYb238]|uniref:hypothetical protein n=1 Tax=Stenotrophomonas sp. MYb238 TaxID=2040281 RepID=UPI00129173D2|nr:hypothetical protein [Stenotrophomonas sp. MYb238]MQP76639.1 hypothetical protein [Stenotrophomonas sp. MYb238]